MLTRSENEKDTTDDLQITIKDITLTVSYSNSKTNKLITALYMVTDIMDADEPIKHKLRELGVGIISDMYSMPTNACEKISEVMSFLDISCSINIVSEMNCSILRKEFLALEKAIRDSYTRVDVVDKKVNLTEFFSEETLSQKQTPHKTKEEKNKSIPTAQKSPTSIGVQKGSTLLRALSDKSFPSVVKKNVSDSSNKPASRDNSFIVLKEQRRSDILSIVKVSGGDATIKDIKDKAKESVAEFNSITSCGEKTLQRELNSMVKDNILDKKGERRWSRYFLKN